jgi:hypothetical protein
MKGGRIDLDDAVTKRSEPYLARRDFGYRVDSFDPQRGLRLISLLDGASGAFIRLDDIGPMVEGADPDPAAAILEECPGRRQFPRRRWQWHGNETNGTVGAADEAVRRPDPKRAVTVTQQSTHTVVGKTVRILVIVMQMSDRAGLGTQVIETAVSGNP